MADDAGVGPAGAGGGRLVIGFPKPSRTARRIATVTVRKQRITTEQAVKVEVRKRDKYRCRFPGCGCGKLGLRLDSSHVDHKRMGGDPRGTKAKAANMVTLCFTRHLDSVVSIHRKTLRVRSLTREGMNGPVAWDVDLSALNRRKRWLEVARETAVQAWEPFTTEQYDLLQRLARMEE